MMSRIELTLSRSVMMTASSASSMLSPFPFSFSCSALPISGNQSLSSRWCSVKGLK